MILECKMQNPDDATPKDIMAEINKANKKIGIGGEKLPLATQQYYLDRDK